MRIEADDLTRPQVHALLQEHLDNMYRWSPPESVHALDLSKLRAPGITFWTAWEGDELAGCGALKHVSAHEGEIKSMRTPERRRRRGAGRAMLEHILAEAKRRGYRRLYLETGSQAGFEPARALYRSRGFSECGPFGDYVADPNSAFMWLALAGGHQLAQVNIARARYPLDDPAMHGFMSRLAEINALAERSPGFVWRLQTPAGDATTLRAFPDPAIIVNMSVWDSMESLRQFAYFTAHVEVFKQRESWFEKLPTAYAALWWVPAGHVPTLEEARWRLARLEAAGPSDLAFDWKQPFPAPVAAVRATA